MAFCSNCGKELNSGARFCDGCGTPISGADNKRNTVYEGDIHKCPHCGEVLNSFVVNCPSCGYELRDVQSSKEIRLFNARLNTFYDRNEKNDFIREYPIPNSKEAIWEFVNLASANIASYDRNGDGTIDKNEQTYIDAWRTLQNRCRDKAKKIYAIDSCEMKEIEELISKSEKTLNEGLRKTKAKKVANASTDILASVFKGFWSFLKLLGRGIQKTWKTKVGKIVLIVLAIIILFSVIFPKTSSPSVNYDTINWTEIELKDYVPNLNKKGNVEENTETSLHIEFIGLTESDHNQVLKDVKAMGYTNVKFTNSVYYDAYNEEEYYLEVWWHSYSGEMDIYLYAPISMSIIDWSTLTLASKLPSISSNEGVIKINTNEKLDIIVDDINESVYNVIVNDCKANGFTIDIVTDNGNFEAFNADGTKIELNYNKYIQNLSILVEIGETYSTFIWPSTKLVKSLPTPKSNIGKITSNSSYSFTVKVANTSFSDFQAYVNECIERGFDDYYWWSDNSFSGENSDGSNLSIKYLGNNVVEISIYNYDLF